MNAEDNTTKDILPLIKSVVSDWANRPVKDIKTATELDSIRNGGLNTLGLMLRARFDNKYGPLFDEKKFEAMWLGANIKTVQHCYWLVDMAFID